MKLESINREIEFRAENRRISGTVISYSDVSPSHRERFEPNSLRFAESVVLNLLHNGLTAVAWTPGGNLELEDTSEELRLSAQMPPIPAGDLVLSLLSEGKIRGLSLEFRAEKERRESGIRIIESALLSGVGLVENPSYKGSQVEIRSESLNWMLLATG